tara:strand:+ start:1355 stop:1636 length:282 start_codon:yes stop_codon:yes gene_type:complete
VSKSQTGTVISNESIVVSLVILTIGTREEVSILFNRINDSCFPERLIVFARGVMSPRYNIGSIRSYVSVGSALRIYTHNDAEINHLFISRGRM